MIKVRKALIGAGRLVRDPSDFGGAMVFFDAFADTRVVRGAYARMLRGLSPREVAHLKELTERDVDVDALSRLPAGTLGRECAGFFRAGVDVNAQVNAHPDLAGAFARDWAYLRFCRVHDFHHVLLGFGLDPQSEMGLQAFNLRNFGEPFAALAMLSTPVTALRHGEPRRLAREVARGWRLAASLPNLFVVPFEDWYEDRLDDVRRRVGLTPSACAPA